MNFFYVNLPTVPNEFVDLCLRNIPLAKSDPTLIELNKKEGISHSITYLPTDVKIWIIKNIIPKIDPTHQHSELIKNMMLHINEYIEHDEGKGVHPIHVDYGRKYAFNYILTLGAKEPPVTTWYLNDKKTVIESHKILPHKWHLIKVNPILHGVSGQEKDQYRTIISLCFDPVDVDVFDPEQYFNNILL